MDKKPQHRSVLKRCGSGEIYAGFIYIYTSASAPEPLKNTQNPADSNQKSSCNCGQDETEESGKTKERWRVNQK